ncbi:MAG: Fic family protein [Candidatus Marinimicrobia bacterium]|nr:Fic family protein [Candidatus Neomarinimicrobiota bacterium]
MSNIKIQIPNPDWGSNLANIILDLEKLRNKKLFGEIPKYIFSQLKEIFQILETLGSARIEGNNTTLSEYVEKIIEKNVSRDEKQIEVENLEKAINFIEENTDETTQFSRIYISELHKIVTKNLTPPPIGEGSNYPGELRPNNVTIKKSNHTPPDFAVLKDHFDEFILFINKSRKEQYQLLMVAIAHYFFTHIHPFDNGNGRMARLLNYAFLIKLGFKVKNGRIINPSSVFYADRNKYYDALSLADSLKDKDLLKWAEYFLLGLKNEIEKIDSLLSRKYVVKKILTPTIKFAYDRESITEIEYNILQHLIKKEDMVLKSEALSLFNIKKSKQKSRIMTKLKDKKIVIPVKKGGRIYTINFVNSYLLRGIIDTLTKEGFVADFLNKN